MKKLTLTLSIILTFLFVTELSAAEYQSTPVIKTKSQLNSGLLAPIVVNDDQSSFNGSNPDVRFKRDLIVKLLYTRSDQSDVYNPNVGWSYTVNYQILSGAMNPGLNYSLTVVFNENGDFIYDAINVHPEALDGAEVEIINVTSSNMALVPNDIELQLNFKGDFICHPDVLPVGPFYLPPYLNLNLAVDRLELTWGNFYCAEEYDVEWIFVDDRSVPAGTTINNNYWESNFDFNPLTKDGTLVNTSDTKYEIDLIYPDGWLIVKVRPVYYYLVPFPDKMRWEGEWIYEFIQLSGFEINKNWEFTSSYIEEGNHKTVGNFSDPTGKVRQTIANLNSEEKTTITEQKYDYEGTPSLQFMPVPDNSGSFGYRSNYNLNASGTEYLKTDYAGIDQVADPSTSTSGSSNYYSSNNNSNSIHRDYIPDAELYPFSQTWFDSKGRIKRQGGVGPLYQLNDEHETKFFYSSVSSTELNRLIGKNIGISTHYQKQYTQDPNGQLSVTYQDMEGKTIATALAGESPNNVVELDYATPTGIEHHLVSIPDDAGDCTTVQHSFMNTIPASTFQFNYDLQGITQQYGSPFNLCLECEYELTIEIRGPECNSGQMNLQSIPSSMDVSQSNSGYLMTDIVTGNQIACTSGYPSYNVSFNATFLSVGEYTVSKKLCALSPTVETLESLMVDNGLIPDQDQMIQDYLNNLDDSPCDVITEDDALLNEVIDASPLSECEGIRWQMIAQLSPNGYYYNANLIPVSDFSPYSFTQADYLDQNEFQSEWAEEILEFHPEYCHYEACLIFVESKQYDIRMSTMLDWTEATNSSPNTFGVNYTDPLNNDPIFDIFSNYGSCDLSSDLEDFINDPLGTGVTLEQQALNLAITSANNNPNQVTYQEQAHWFLFRSLYMDYKRQLIESLTEGADPCLDCSYLTIDEAIVSQQDQFDDIEDQSDLDDWFSENVTDQIDCTELCMTSVDIWMEHILESCSSLTSVEQQEIESGLMTFCANRCDAGQPFGYILQNDWDNNQDFLEVRNLLQNSSSCNQDILAQLVLPTICNSVPGDTIVNGCIVQFFAGVNEIYQQSSNCLNEVPNPPSFDFLNCSDLFAQSLGNGSTNLEENFSNIANLNTGIDWLDSNQNFVCELIYFYDIFGNQITPSQIDYNFPPYHYPSNLTSIGNLDFTHIAFDYLDDNCDLQTAFLYSGCDIGDPWVQDSLSLFVDEPEYATICAPNLTWGLIDSTQDPCIDALQADAEYQALLDWNNLLTELVDQFYADQQSCFADPFTETFTISGEISEYHYTLYHYDQAGNLISTLPPEAVKPKNDIDPNIDYNGEEYVGADPNHNWNLASFYEYNSINQITTNESPDGGRTNFKYDDKGMLRFSQNAKQLVENEWSYTKYDRQNRIKEVGQYGPLASLTNADINNRDFPENQVFTTNTIPHSKEIVKTYYDKAAPNVTIPRSNLRGRVSGILKMPYDGYISSATYYGYDMVGNAKTIEQKLGGLEPKIIEYKYDQLPGNVNEVKYQQGEWDEYFYRYNYDADNRLYQAESSRDGQIYKTDATYSYYSHGPLARIELGHDVVQGLDYYYTLQGWTKGMNIPEITNLHDPGADGYIGANLWNARDTISFALQYNTEDYLPIGNINLGVATPSSLNTMQANGSILQSGLYNGNIASMSTDIPVIPDNSDQNIPSALQGMGYQYDQLNRIKSAQSYELNLNDELVRTADERYDANYSYDKLGNILSLSRKGSVGQLIDDFTYNYDYIVGTNDLLNNQLLSVSDAAGFQSENDLDDQQANNYDYDPIGQLTKDEQANIQSIEWTATGKVKQINFDGTHFDNVDRIFFVYDGLGNRVKKVVDQDTERTITHYIRDASGNILSIYSDRTEIHNGLDPIQEIGSTYIRTKAEQHLYGSQRLGIDSYSEGEALRLYFDNLVANNYNLVDVIELPTIDLIAPKPIPRIHYSSLKYNRKEYEISNHLGNALGTISDLKLGIDRDSDSVVDEYEANIMLAKDYFPFGMSMSNRLKFNEYRMGFQGQEIENEIDYSGNINSYKFRNYNGRTCRFYSSDPAAFHPNQLGKSPYGISWNNPIYYIDKLGLCPECDDESYTIQKGDNFWDLENKWELVHGTLSDLNPSLDPKNLAIGESIRIVKSQLVKSNENDGIRFMDINQVSKQELPIPNRSDIVYKDGLPYTKDTDVQIADGRGWEFTFGFAFLGGMSSSVGQVYDNNGNSRWFYENAGNIGFGLEIGFSGFIIHSKNGNDRFNLSMFEGDASGFNAGFIFFGYDWGGNIPKDANGSETWHYGKDYTYKGLGIGVPTEVNFGLMWQKSETKYFD